MPPVGITSSLPEQGELPSSSEASMSKGSESLAQIEQHTPSFSNGPPMTPFEECRVRLFISTTSVGVGSSVEWDIKATGKMSYAFADLPELNGRILCIRIESDEPAMAEEGEALPSPLPTPSFSTCISDHTEVVLQQGTHSLSFLHVDTVLTWSLDDQSVGASDSSSGCSSTSECALSFETILGCRDFWYQCILPFHRMQVCRWMGIPEELAGDATEGTSTRHLLLIASLSTQAARGVNHGIGDDTKDEMEDESISGILSRLVATSDWPHRQSVSFQRGLSRSLHRNVQVLHPFYRCSCF